MGWALLVGGHVKSQFICTTEAQRKRSKTIRIAKSAKKIEEEEKKCVICENFLPKWRADARERTAELTFCVGRSEGARR